MYAYIPSPFGGRLPSYALAKADKPKEPKAEEPKAEEPKPTENNIEEPKPAETKTEPKAGETGTEGTPPPEPAPEEEAPDGADQGGKTPPKKRVSNLDLDSWKIIAPQIDWEAVSEKYAHLPDGKKKQFESQLRYARNGPRSALEWLDRQDKARFLGNVGERAASKALEGRADKIARLEAEGVDLDTYKGRVTPTEKIRSKEDNEAEGIKQIPSGQAVLVDEVDENGNKTGRKILANNNVKSKASARLDELNKKLLADFKLSREEARTRTGMFKEPTAGDHRDITVLQTGEGKETGEEQVNFIDPNKKEQVNKYAQPLIGVIYDKDGDPINVRVAPVRTADTKEVYTEFFDDHGDVLDLDRLNDEGLEQFDVMLKDPENIRTMWRGMPNERQVIPYLENTYFKSAYFQGGKMLDNGKYEGKMWDIGEGMRAGAVINPDTKKAEAVFFKGDNNVPIRAARGEDGQLIASTANLTDEQKQAILKELDDFHPYRNANGEVVGEPEQKASWKEQETIRPKKRQFYGGNITSRGTYRGYSEDIGADVRAGAYINPKTDEAEPVFLVGEGSNIPVKIARDEQGNITNPELTDEQKKVILDRINDFHPYRDLAGNVMEADEAPKPVKRVPKGPLYRIDRKTNTINLSRTNAERFGNARYSDDTVEIDGDDYYKVLDARGNVVGYHLAEDVPDEDEEPTEPAAKSATMTMREMRMPSISDMIRDRRLRSAPYPSVTPLGRALP